MALLPVLVLLFLLTSTSAWDAGRLRHRWKTPNFMFPDDSTEEEMTEKGVYVPNTGYLLDVDRHEDTDRTFVTLPQFGPGTMVSLATVVNNSQVDDPLLAPYPDWSWYQGDCDGLVSVIRMKVDVCDRLWVVDSGVVDVIDTFDRKCPPKIVVFDLNTDRVLKTHIIDSANLQPKNLLISVEVETDMWNCGDSYAYIADGGADKMIVYSLAKDRSWWIDSTTFSSDPEYSNMTISNVTFSLPDGLFAMALSPKTITGDRILFYHSLSSPCESYIYTSILKNEDNFRDGNILVPNAVNECSNMRSAQSAAEAMDSNGNLFFSIVSDNAIYVWNWEDQFTDQNVRVALQNDTSLQFPSGMKVIPGMYDDEVWTITPRFQLIVTTGLDREEYNFHIVTGAASELAKGCESCKQNGVTGTAE